MNKRKLLTLMGGAKTPWYLANKTIPSANLLEYVELPAAGKLYAGAAVASGQPWTVAVKTTTYVPAATSYFLFDSATGRIVIGIGNATSYGINNGTIWTNAPLYPDTNVHIIFIVSNGANIQEYLDNTAVGSNNASNKGIGGATRWRSDNSSASTNVWTNSVPKGAVYNIALSEAQRNALYATMLP